MPFGTRYKRLEEAKTSTDHIFRISRSLIKEVAYREWVVFLSGRDWGCGGEKHLPRGPTMNQNIKVRKCRKLEETVSTSVWPGLDLPRGIVVIGPDL